MDVSFLDDMKSLVCLVRGFRELGVWVLRARPVRSSGRVQADDISIFYRRYGCGEPVLMLHGGFMFAETWGRQIPAIQENYEVIATDARGHGRTTLGTHPLTYRQMADDAIRLIESLELGPVHLVGWSDGGCVSLGVAIERPDLVRSMVLLGTSFSVDNYSSATRAEIEKFMRWYSPELMLFRAGRWIMSPEALTTAEFIRRMGEMWRELPDYTFEEMGRIEAPTLVIGTNRDEWLSMWPDPLKVFKETAEAIPGAELRVIPGGTHLVHIIQPGTVNPIILDFLARH